MKGFCLNVKAEFFKTKGTAAVWLTILGAIFVPGINFIICMQRPDVMVGKLSPEPWLMFLRFNWKNVAAIILPLYGILMTSLIVQIEYRNHTWKQVYALPRTFADIFFSKVIVIHTFLLSFLVLFNIAIVASGLLTSQINPKYVFPCNGVPWMMMLTISSRVYLGLLAVMSIQYWLSLRFRNFAISLGVGMGLWIVGIVLMDWDKIIYYPYMYSFLMFFTDFKVHPETLLKLTISSIVSFIIFITLCFIDICKLPERG